MTFPAILLPSLTAGSPTDGPEPPGLPGVVSASPAEPGLPHGQREVNTLLGPRARNHCGPWGEAPSTPMAPGCCGQPAGSSSFLLRVAAVSGCNYSLTFLPQLFQNLFPLISPRPP